MTIMMEVKQFIEWLYIDSRVVMMMLMGLPKRKRWIHPSGERSNKTILLFHLILLDEAFDRNKSK